MATTLFLILALLFSAGCSDNDDAEPTVAPREFIGFVQSSPAMISLSEETGAAGRQASIFLTDGFPNGLAEFFSGPIVADRFNLSSASGNATIEGRLLANGAVEGTVRLPDGSTRNIEMIRAPLGAGRYDVTIDSAGRWSGTNIEGKTLQAQQTGNLVAGSVTASGERYEFNLHDLSRTLSYGAGGGAPGRYTILARGRADVIMGRGGAVASGAPDANFVSLGLPITSEVLPGVFYGRLRFQSDLLLIDINEPAVAGGPRSLRAYVSDGEPEPEGDIEWFQGTFSGDSFAFTSARGDASISGTVSAAGVTGSLTYGSGPALPLFAGPAGEGAGIYDVVVDANGRLTGTSEEGGRIDFTRNGTDLPGTLTTPAGTVIRLEGRDLVRTLRYPNAENIATVQDSYVAFFSPRARNIVGRSGNVRGGSAGRNIIGVGTCP